jgi:hypothetical protein
MSSISNPDAETFVKQGTDVTEHFSSAYKQSCAALTGSYGNDLAKALGSSLRADGIGRYTSFHLLAH